MPAQTPVLLRPAIIELRYDDKPHFTAAVKLYEGILVRSEETAPAVNIRVFTVGRSKKAKHKDLFLRLTYPLSGQPVATDRHTVIYWYVKGKKTTDLTAQYNTINTVLVDKLTEAEHPATYLYQDSSAAVRGLGAAAPEAGRSLLNSPSSDSYLGITINPPVPTLTSTDDEGHLFNAKDGLNWLGKIEPDGGITYLLIAAFCAVFFRVGLRQGLRKARLG